MNSARRAGGATVAALLLAFVLSAIAVARRDDPPVTILYQNFPNPFPTSLSASTCIWFDLRVAGEVHLDVFTLRGVHVRSIVPSRNILGRLPAGRYGRGPSGNSGCDPRFAWDGHGDDGSTAPAGLYLVRLRADGTDAARKALFQGN